MGLCPSGLLSEVGFCPSELMSGGLMSGGLMSDGLMSGGLMSSGLLSGYRDGYSFVLLCPACRYGCFHILHTMACIDRHTRLEAAAYFELCCDS